MCLCGRPFLTSSLMSTDAPEAAPGATGLCTLLERRLLRRCSRPWALPRPRSSSSADAAEEGDSSDPFCSPPLSAGGEEVWWACGGGGGLGSTHQAGFVSAITTSCLAGQSARAYAPGGGAPTAAVGAAWSAAGCGGLTPGASDKRAAFETVNSPSGESSVLLEGGAAASSCAHGGRPPPENAGPSVASRGGGSTAGGVTVAEATWATKENGPYARRHSGLTRWLTPAVLAALCVEQRALTRDLTYAGSLRGNVCAVDPVFLAHPPEATALALPRAAAAGDGPQPATRQGSSPTPCTDESEGQDRAAP